MDTAREAVGFRMNRLRKRAGILSASAAGAPYKAESPDAG